VSGRTLSALAALGVTALLAPAGGQSALQVSHRARALAPGEVVELIVSSPAPLDAVAAEAFDQRVIFVPGGQPGEWRGLLGLDLDTPAGRQTVAISTLAAGGAPGPDARHVLDVQPRTFPTRRLTVDDRYINPPARALQRIERESARNQALLSSVTPSRLWSAPFVAPVPGSPTSSFGRRNVLNGQPRSPHSGTDFRAPTGTPVRAPNAGRVALAEEQYFSGNTVLIDHGLGLFSFLAHLSETSVAEGQAVDRGQVVGKAGATGRVTGPHLHWTVRLNGARIDPLALLALLGDR